MEDKINAEYTTKDVEKAEGIAANVKDTTNDSDVMDDKREVEFQERSWRSRILSYGVEARGIAPVPVDEKTDTAYSRMFTFYIAVSVNVLPFSTGSLGPLVYGLNTRNSCLIILFINLLCTIPPAYFTTFGPKLGFRQMVFSRYSFGYYGVILPVSFNLLGMIGFNIVDSILGGQTLASVADGGLSWTVGIVIVAVVSLVISFMGYSVLHWYERFAWIPVIITFVIAMGVGGHHLSNPIEFEPATAPAVLSFASVLVGFVLTYVGLSADFSCYMPINAPSKRIFLYTYFGLLTPIVLLQCLGAAVGACVPNVPSWEAGYENGSVGGLLAAMLSPVGNFGKFLIVLLALSVMGNIAATFYSISLNFQIMFPFLVAVPRYAFSIIGTAIVIPLAVAGQHRFFDALSNFLGLIGYWSAAYAIILTIEHFVFRKGNAANYDASIWNNPRKLPIGIAAFFSLAAGFCIAIPAMDQVWYVGPIAKTTGDLGFELAFVTGLVVYPVLRWLEIKWSERRG